MTRSQKQKPVRCASFVALLGALSAPLAAGCLLQHDGAQGSDTATNWLRACERQGDCGGKNGCIDHVCTVTCEIGATSACSSLNSDASCQMRNVTAPAQCDLPCSSDAFCADFRAGYVCAAGVCRPPEQAPAMSTSTPMSSGAVSSDSAEDVLLLSDPERNARSPVVEWLDDHWRVVWTTDSFAWDPATREANKPVEPRLEVADITTNGTVTTRGMVHETAEPGGPTLVQGGPGQVAYLQAPELRGGPCQLRIIATEQPELRAAFEFECADRGGVAPIPKSEDWLVTWYSNLDVSANLMLGRYRPAGGDWLAGPWDLQETARRPGLGFAAVAGDAWFGVSSYTPPDAPKSGFVHVAGVATAQPSEPSLPVQARPLDASQPSQYQAFAEAPDGALMFYTFSNTLRSVHITDTMAEETTLAPASGSGGSSGHKGPGVVRIPELGRTIVCYAGNFGGTEKAALVAVDDRGQLIGEPIAISDDGYIVSCELAWSGDALLATWLDIASRPSFAVRARIVSPP